MATLPVNVVLVRLSFLVQSVYAEVCAMHDLTPAQAQLLCLIKDQPRGMTELTQVLGLERPGLTGLVDRVQRRGLLVRGGAPQDRRAVILTPTPEGKRLADQFYGEVSDRLTELAAGLSSAERHHLESAGSKIIAGQCVPAVFGPEQ